MHQIGVIGTAQKADEKRVPIHPDHLHRVPEEFRRRLVFEQGYGAPFGLADAEIAAQSGGVATRRELLAELGAVILPKPVRDDLQMLRKGGILWGWTHVVQQQALTQVAIDRKQTLIAFEDMFIWAPDGHIGRHTFYKNNELAGYCGVLHALQLRGIDGHYGKQRTVIVISFGSVSRGAIYALKARGFRDITICIQRPDHDVREEVLGCHYVRIRRGGEREPRLLVVEHDGGAQPFIELIGEADIIVNGISQDPDHPLMFVTADEVSRFKRDCLIVDVSCDEGMGFPFARPTSFQEPMLRFGEVDYYAVDHTPSYLWESASRSISAALIVHLPTVLGGPARWQHNETIRRAIVIEAGVVLKPEVLSFQRRRAAYPHALCSSPSV